MFIQVTPLKYIYLCDKHWVAIHFSDFSIRTITQHGVQWVFGDLMCVQNQQVDFVFQQQKKNKR